LRRAMNWDDPVARYNLIERVGIAEYNRLIQQHFVDSTVSTVNGYPIRPVGSRFGTIYMIDGANTGFRTQAESEAYAATLPPRE
jgi:hypothetical protein